MSYCVKGKTLAEPVGKYKETPVKLGALSIFDLQLPIYDLRFRIE